MRRFVIGDIHGCSKALRTLIETIDPTPDDELVFLGDYIDRGPDSRNVIDQLITLKNRCRVVPLRGNHEIMLLGVLLGGCQPQVWLSGGGHSTIASYGGTLSRIPAEHVAFFRSLRPFYETADSIFVHAGYRSDVAMNQLDEATAYWTHLTPPPPPPHHSGKTVFVGHTPQPLGNVLDWGHLVCLDTYCFGGGYLTAIDVHRRDTIQVDVHGHLRRQQELLPLVMLRRMRDYVSRKFRQRDAEGPLTQPVSQDV